MIIPEIHLIFDLMSDLMFDNNFDSIFHLNFHRVAPRAKGGYRQRRGGGALRARRRADLEVRERRADRQEVIRGALQHDLPYYRFQKTALRVRNRRKISKNLATFAKNVLHMLTKILRLETGAME